MIRYLLASLLLIAPAAWAEYPAPTDNYVNDFSSTLLPSERDALRTLASQLEQETGVELTFVLIDRVSTYHEGASIESFATRLFNNWGVGNKTLNDGILVLMASSDRAVRIELGAGYGYEYDADMQQIIDSDMLPAFKKGRYGKGLIEGAESIASFAQDWHTLRESDSFSQRVWFKIKSALRSLWIKLALLFAAGGIGWQIFRRWNRNHPRRCEQCNADMVRLSEVLDDRYLDAGQKAEERVGTVDYDVWKCTQCAYHLVIDYPVLLSRYQRCDSCRRRACEKQSRTVLGDRVTTTYRCRHCQHIQQTYSTVSTSRSGGSGFGGGSSGGGGATGRW